MLDFRARNYDSDLGMFYAPDPAGQGYARYGYVGGNPVSFKDPTGRDREIMGYWYADCGGQYQTQSEAVEAEKRDAERKARQRLLDWSRECNIRQQAAAQARSNGNSSVGRWVMYTPTISKADNLAYESHGEKVLDPVDIIGNPLPSSVFVPGGDGEDGKIVDMVLVAFGGFSSIGERTKEYLAKTRIYYAKFDGSIGWLSTKNISRFCKVGSKILYYADVFVNVTRSINNDKDQPWNKTFVSAGVGFAALMISGPVGATIGFGYIILDETGVVNMAINWAENNIRVVPHNEPKFDNGR